MLYPRIVEVSTDKKTGLPFFLIHFWKTKAARTRRDEPYLINSHVMALRLTDELEPQIMSNIRRYARAAEECGYRGDHSTANAITADAFFEGDKMISRKGMPLREPTQRDQSDPHGILANPEVAALPGKDIDLEAAPRQP
jgi:hypothetical protein